MSKKSGVLLVEDDPNVVIIVSDVLEHMGLEVVIARDGLEGLRLAIEKKPDLIILDVMMPEVDGYEVCRRLRADLQTRHIPILMLTAKGQEQEKADGLNTGADAYLAKPYAKAVFEAHVKALLRRAVTVPFPLSQKGPTLVLTCVPGREIVIKATGSGWVSDISEEALRLDATMRGRQGDAVPFMDWRFTSKQLGRDLFREILIDHSDVFGRYQQALGEVSADETQLHLSVESQRDFLRVPLECLFDDVNQPDYLALRHTLSRSVIGVHTKRLPLSPNFFNDLYLHDRELKVLLIASNTPPDIAGVDDEIVELAASIRTNFESRGLRVRLKCVPTEFATCEYVRNTLRHSEYHIVHYAGHGTFVSDSPEKSCLSFWRKPNREGGVEHLRASELQMLVHDSAVRFLYLSCCLGTMTGEPDQLLNDDFLGIADGLINSGVPALLGFRWRVSDSGAKALAVCFYNSLAAQGWIDTALLDA